MSDKVQRSIRIKWVRSGIGFSYHQKRIVRSLGLMKLNQEVERPDTPQVRGLVAKVPHLVEIVEAAPKAAWTLVPEYIIHPPEAVRLKPVEKAPEAPAGATEKTEGAVSPPPAPLPSSGGKSVRGAAGEAVASTDQGEILRSAQDDNKRAQNKIEAETAEAATETSGELAATRASESTGSGGAESAEEGEEVSREEGQPRA